MQRTIYKEIAKRKISINKKNNSELDNSQLTQKYM